MTSEERHEMRYQRRIKNRRQKKLKRIKQYTDFNKVFSFETMLQAYKKCKQNVMWKGSTQHFMNNVCQNLNMELQLLKSGKWQTYGFYEFDIIERGKPRHIRSVKFAEKGVQNALCNNCLIPILQPLLIYDNGATLPGRGTDFAIRRLTRHLTYHYHLYGRQGGIYFFDFSKYFDNIINPLLLKNMKKQIVDQTIMKLTSALIYAFGNKGLGLGSQVSQISAVFYPNNIDHFIKDKLGIKTYGRYMDDGYIIHNNIEELKQIVKKFEEKCKELGIILNKKKCRIIKLTSQFSYLKIRFFITETGKIIRRLSREGVTKERKRLRKYFKYLQEKRMTFKQVYYNFHSWLCSRRNGYSFHIKLNMVKYFNNLYEKDYTYYRPCKLDRRKYKILKFIAKIARFV